MTEELVKRDELVKRLEDMLTMLIIDNGFHPNSYHANTIIDAIRTLKAKPEKCATCVWGAAVCRNCGAAEIELTQYPTCEEYRTHVEECATHPTTPASLCEDCPPVGYPTEKTRCDPCPRRTPANHEGQCDHSWHLYQPNGFSAVKERCGKCWEIRSIAEAFTAKESQ